VKRALFVVALACIVVVPVACARSHRAQLWVGGTAPLMIRGSGFKARESVKVIVFLQREIARGVTKKTTMRRTVTATAAGTFAVRFRTAASGCGIPKVIARGSLGSRAAWLVPSRACGAKAIYAE